MAVQTSLRPTSPVGDPGRTTPARRPYPAVLAWLLLALLLAAVVAVPFLPVAIGDVLRLAVAAAGIAGLVAGIRWHRPVPATPWWLLAAGAVISVVAVAIIYSGEGRQAYEAPAPAVGMLFTASSVLAIAGFAAAGRPGRGRSGWVNLVDAMIVAAAMFPLLWTLVIDPVVDSDRFPVAATVTIPIVVVLTLVAAVKLLFVTGARMWSTWWLAISAAGMLVTNIAALLPAVLGESHTVSAAIDVTWLVLPTCLGIAGLHPSLTHAATPSERPDRDLSVRRLVLLGALALLVPAGTALDMIASMDRLRTWSDAASLLIPVLVVALLLVIRLAIIARVAHRRATELAHQARVLDAALREQEALRQELTYQALHDPLTGLENRVVLAERLESALTRGTGTGQHALLLFDLDGFKDVNDTLGHQVGDELLVAAAHRVRALLTDSGTLARLGGDEFAVLLEETDPDAATGWADRTLQAVRRPFDIAGRQLYLTTSIGIATLDAGDEDTTPSGALRDADLALYEAKAAGKNRALVFEPAMREAWLAHSRLRAGLRRALLDGELALRYQPMVDLVGGQVHAVEALLRWTTSTGTAVMPDEFVPIAEETGMIREIGEWVLRQACAQAQPWYQDRGVAVSVNVSGRQLVDPRFAEVVSDALAAAGLPGAALIIEVTETSMVGPATDEAIVAQLNRLRDQGVRVAIDDFGTGYSSLSYLSRLPVDILKMDSSFAPGGLPLARAIIELGEELRLTTVAEGVETAEQAAVLRRLGCQLAQGHLFSKPVAAGAVDRLLSTPISRDRPAGSTC